MIEFSEKNPSLLLPLNQKSLPQQQHTFSTKMMHSRNRLCQRLEMRKAKWKYDSQINNTEQRALNSFKLLKHPIFNVFLWQIRGRQAGGWTPGPTHISGIGCHGLTPKWMCRRCTHTQTCEHMWPALVNKLICFQPGQGSTGSCADLLKQLELVLVNLDHDIHTLGVHSGLSDPLCGGHR